MSHQSSEQSNSRELISFREYARRRGVDLRAVQKAIETGRISTVEDCDGKIKIDPLKADEEWQRNTDHSKRPPKPGEKKAQEAFDYYAAKAKREFYLAEMARLEFEKAAGITVSMEDLKIQILSASKSLKDSLFNIPRRISSQLALETSAIKIDALITHEILQTLEGFLRELECVAQPKE